MSSNGSHEGRCSSQGSVRNTEQSPLAERPITRPSTGQAVQTFGRRRRRSSSSDGSYTNAPPRRLRPANKRSKLNLRMRDGSQEPEKIDRRRRPEGKHAERVAMVKGTVGANFRAKGETKKIKGKLFFRDDDFPEWTRGVYHETYRRQFIREDARRGRFTRRPDRGSAPGDETSFIDYQKDWSSDPATWDNIRDEQGRRVFRESTRPADLERQEKPGWWYLDDTVLLDQDNHPLREIPGLNRTFSSALEGWHLDALRKRYPHSNIQDFRGRMPHTRKFCGRTLPIQGFEAFTNRAYRFRKAHNIPDWHPRSGAEAKNGMAEPEEGGKYGNVPSRFPPIVMEGSGNEGVSYPSDFEGEEEEEGSEILSIDSNYWAEFPAWNEVELLQATDAPTSDDPSIDVVPLFATASDERLARLQNENLTSPRAVMFEWLRGRGAATNIYLVMRPHNAARYVDPETNETHDNVAVLSDEDIARLEQESSTDINLRLRWFK